METDKLNNLYEQTRTYLLLSEKIENGIKELRNKRLKEHLTGMMHTYQADLLILNDFLFEASTCDDSEIESLIVSTDVFEQPQFEEN